ncbi:pectinacetylesterase family protein [Aquabacterium sp. CECT 9606]|uniref:pectinacetylesterase family protein n=1 Tax=Aquabacterium sp. CECT 9606 TaxID=2845822 RepID=UPI001E5E1DF1|nr:pectinacetylesterase family protein [Aquabacterium sp. CECT 9606]CAH0351668.1 hypothetical protein AQB9606_02333 [Aquabacterium sp. CECT 9606]
MKSHVFKFLLATASICCGAANAAYFKWESVELPASSGASCGDGSPYRFFVNKTPFTTNTVILFEGGGACWAQDSCLGKKGLAKSASNPNGIAADYMTRLTPSQPNAADSPLGKINLSFLGLITPFSARIHPLQSVETQSWNIVYVPYCTGDVHTGNSTQVYADSNPDAPRVQYHRGYLNAKGVSAWVGANMPRPDKLLVTGFSAGGVGSQAAYPTLRDQIKPKQSALLADSGPLMWAPADGDPAQYPSVPLHNKIRKVWGYDTPKGIVTELMARYPGKGDANNLGSFVPEIAKIYPNDRFSLVAFQRDAIFSGFSYDDFHPELGAIADEKERKEQLLAKWDLELNTLVNVVKGAGNIGWYMPYERDLMGAHCLTTVTFGGTAIAESKHKSVGVIVDNLINGSGAPIRSYEKAKVIQSPTGVSLFDNLLNSFFDSLL